MAFRSRALIAFLAATPFLAIASYLIVVARQPQVTAEDLSRQAYREFAANNPRSLEGYSELEPKESLNSKPAWELNGIVYSDQNGDGSVDLKYRLYPHFDTTTLHWEDSDFDGDFDTLVSQGCFHKIASPLTKEIAVPQTVSGTNASNSLTGHIESVRGSLEPNVGAKPTDSN